MNQVGQVTEDKEQESDSGEEETQVRKRKSSILRSIIHLFRCERFPVSLYLIERRSRENWQTTRLFCDFLDQFSKVYYGGNLSHLFFG